MSAPPGWYPDPGGRPGEFRFWDGRSWSAVTSRHPNLPYPTGPGRTPPLSQSGPLGTGRPPRRNPIGWILGVLGALGVIVLAVVLITNALSASGRREQAPQPDPTSATPSAASCPSTAPGGSPSAALSGGRVVSGRLSYPLLPSPFSPPIGDSRVPFGRDVRSQEVVLERSGSKPTWAADVLIARLLAGDGFYGPQQGSQIVVSCILGRFYGDNRVARHDTTDRATTVDGHRAWLVESHLSYAIPGVRAKGELLIVEVIDVGGGEGGLFYASLPDTAPQLVDPAKRALAGLRVS